ncbi:MAG: indole-3-glycerol phosphate synthase TrpC [Cytophagaceae bacterium]|jgi:indole-3-glycerol phosphate synthase|nr:indole-3-glycerol phosphate synthase TrpC [Cytophagaceae bacterium]
MSTILDKIVEQKKQEVAQRKSETSLEDLRRSPYFSKPKYSLTKSLLHPEKSGIIAEHKRKSPSKGIINASLSLEQVVKGYEAAGASAISVLTDIDFFGGHPHDLRQAREMVRIPLLRKDFMIDEYQFYEACAWGADIVLLIAACLSPEETKRFALLAHQLGMEVILEVHDEAELLSHYCPECDCVGVNNRNLKTFEVDVQTSLTLVSKIPDQTIKISESGIDNPFTIGTLKKAGFQGFLIGENFMKTNDPGISMKEFISKM